MARGILVSIAGYPYTPSSLMPDNGLASLAGALLEAGHGVRVLDYGTVDMIEKYVPPALHKKLTGIWEAASSGSTSPLLVARLMHAGRLSSKALKRTLAEVADQISAEIESFGADFVGFKLWNGDGFTSSVELARKLRRRHPGLKIIGGGSQVDWFEECIFDYTDAFDVLARGEGEETIVRLAEWAEGARQLEGIPNVLYRGDLGQLVKTPLEPVADLDSLPLPSYDAGHYPSLEGDRHLKMVTIDESRGCPNDCHFCIHPRKSSRRWRIKSPARLISEMKRVIDQLGADTFIYAGSNTPSKAAVANAQAIIDAGLEVRYAGFGHAKGMKKADFDVLARSGCRALFYGVESGSQRILDESLNKGTRVEEIRDILLRTKEAGIYTIGSIIFPAPFEDDASRKETMDLLLETRPDSVPVQFPGLVPGCNWDREPDRFGFEIPRGRKAAMRYGLTYKIKLIYPPRFWKPLPYLLNGLNSRQLFEKTGAFAKELNAAGITTNVAHDMVLMADKLGMSPEEFHKEAMRLFYTGDAEGIKAMVRKMNSTRAASLPSTFAETHVA